MPHYIIKYTSSKSGACEYQMQAKDMVSAVSFVVCEAKKRLINLSDISVQIKGQRPVQQFCNRCLTKEASYGFIEDYKRKWYCKECKN